MGDTEKNYSPSHDAQSGHNICKESRLIAFTLAPWRKPCENANVNSQIFFTLMRQPHNPLWSLRLHDKSPGLDVPPQQCEHTSWIKQNAKPCRRVYKIWSRSLQRMFPRSKHENTRPQDTRDIQSEEHLREYKKLNNKPNCEKKE